MFVGVGDLIGGLPAISSFTQDEATINILNQLGMALVNPGGVRSGLRRSGAITYEDLFSVAPFGNNLCYTDLTGVQLICLLEHQWEQPNC